MISQSELVTYITFLSSFKVSYNLEGGYDETGNNPFGRIMNALSYISNLCTGFSYNFICLFFNALKYRKDFIAK